MSDKCRSWCRRLCCQPGNLEDRDHTTFNAGEIPIGNADRNPGSSRKVGNGAKELTAAVPSAETEPCAAATVHKESDKAEDQLLDGLHIQHLTANKFVQVEEMEPYNLSSGQHNQSDILTWNTGSCLDDSSSPRAGLVGLGDLGSTSSINSVLQCISNIHELTKYFVNKDYEKDLNIENPFGRGGKIAKAYADLVTQIWMPKGHVIYPTEFKSIMARYTHLIIQGLEDSHESLHIIIDFLHEDLNRISRRSGPYTMSELIRNKEYVDKSDADKARESWEWYTARNNSVIVDLFCGQVRNVIRCPDCKKAFTNFDPLMIYSLPLPVNQKKELIDTFMPPHADLFVDLHEDTLEKVHMEAAQPVMDVDKSVPCGREAESIDLKDCFKLYLQPKELHEVDIWTCPVCKEEKRAVTKLDLYKMPQYLFVHLRRFQYTSTACNLSSRKKLDAKVKIPLTGFDLSDLVINPGERPVIYDLVGQSCHSEKLDGSGGHYWAVCRNEQDQKWYNFNDSMVRPADNNDMELWEQYIDNVECPLALRYCAGLLLYVLVFASHRLVECPDTVWFAAEEQYLPIWKIVYQLLTSEKTALTPSLCAALLGVYAEVTINGLDTSREECTFEEAGHVIDYCINRIEAFVAGISSDGENQREDSSSSAVPTFQLVPVVSEELEIHLLCRFLSCLESSPQRNDAFKKSMEERQTVILQLALKFLRIQTFVSAFVMSSVVRLLANMCAFSTFCKQMTSDPSTIAYLLSMEKGGVVDTHIQQCTATLLEPRFWSPGDPVGALATLTQTIISLKSFAGLTFTPPVIKHLRNSDAFVYLSAYIAEGRFFDPRRTAGKELAVAASLDAIREARSLACEICRYMTVSPVVQHILSRWPFFQSRKTWERNMIDDKLDHEARLLHDVLHPSGVPGITAPEKPTILVSTDQSSLALDLMLRPCFPEYQSQFHMRGRAYKFSRLKTTGDIELPVRAGTCVASVFVGSKHDKAVLRTDTGHLIGVDLDSLEITFMSFEDWYYKQLTDMTSLPSDSNKFILTSKTLVSQASPRKSHLWAFNGVDRCRRVAEYDNCQFLRPSLINDRLAVGHSPLWRKRHGYYFTFDLETQKRVTLLGPLKDEERHPNFPSFHCAEDIVISMGTIWDTRSGQLVHRFDHFGGWGNNVENVFHPNGVHVLMDADVWDLRNYCLIRQVETLVNCRMSFNATGDIIYGKHKNRQGRYDELAILDAHRYSEIEYVPFPGYISNASLDQYDRRLIVSYTAGFPVVLEVGGNSSYDA
ncbi:uncharacterized protein LOC129585186 [Paramacrobiotus metropolitanus]|uniref:uncharacterized protein LOC129585186 n=1 Tax=Paramacrobiotus metropolitanus TaxID=2943436 RepID=UPI0024458348|nr:uncharacterized protein LOC129585186 [Paramacrobiotus metropolitanus]